MTDQRWWHGGVGGLRPGDLLLPPAVTAVTTTGQWMSGMGFDPHENGVERDRMRRDRVYLTHDREMARAYAASWTINVQSGLTDGQGTRYGALYVARPAGEWWTDPDLPDDSIECERAEVVEVYNAAVVLPWSAVERRMLAKVGAR